MNRRSLYIVLIAVLALWLALPMSGMARKATVSPVNVSLDTATTQMLQYRGLNKQDILRVEQLMHQFSRSALEISELRLATNNWSEVSQLLRMLRDSLDWETLRLNLNHGMTVQDFLQAEKIAQKYKRTISDVVRLKSVDLTWEDVRLMVRDYSKPLTKLQVSLGLNFIDVINYRARGFLDEEINTAAFLAKQTGKSVGAVLEFKKPKTSWLDVMKSLGIVNPVKTSRDYQQFKKSHQ